jgi:hypothetical protein
MRKALLLGGHGHKPRSRRLSRERSRNLISIAVNELHEARFIKYGLMLEALL